MSDEKGGPEVIPTGAGKVYVFNVTSAQIQLILNGTFIANLPVAGAAAASYAPTATPVQRIQAGTTQTGQFADSNKMQVGSTNNYIYQVTLPTNSSGTGTPVYPYASDVLMFVANSSVAICTPDGNNYQSLNGTMGPASPASGGGESE